MAALQVVFACLAVSGVVAFARKRGVPALPAGLAAAAAWVPIGVLVALRPRACPECRYASSHDVLECESCGARWKPDPEIEGGEAV